MRGLVIRDVSIRLSQQVFNEDVDHESQQEIGQLFTVNPSNPSILYISMIMFVIMVNIV